MSRTRDRLHIDGERWNAAMADGPKNFRDPVIHDDKASANGIGRWIGIALAVLIGLLLLSWLLGLFGDDDDAVITETGDPAVVVTE